MNVGLQLDKAAPLLSGLKKPMVVAKVDADKYTNLASKHDIEKADLLVRYLTKFVAPDVAILCSDSAIREFIEAAGIYFPTFIGFGLNESTISNLPIKYKKRSWFSVAKDFSDNITTQYDFDKAPALAAIHLASKEHSIFYRPLEDMPSHARISFQIAEEKEHLKNKCCTDSGSLEDDPRKFVATILNDEGDDKSKGLLKGEDFAESFDVSKKTKLPRMVLWDGNEEYYLWNGFQDYIGGREVDAKLDKFHFMVCA
ncbi:protein disulfide isomerase-like 5-2 [Primulina tabacum]|uniref:protein disulfide isomerase-like 5-2 n=1 Tax=Primulina tabacum TaxID=48773 RepID=UPI003F596475